MHESEPVIRRVPELTDAGERIGTAGRDLAHEGGRPPHRRDTVASRVAGVVRQPGRLEVTTLTVRRAVVRMVLGGRDDPGIRGERWRADRVPQLIRQVEHVVRGRRGRRRGRGEYDARQGQRQADKQAAHQAQGEDPNHPALLNEVATKVVMRNESQDL